LFTDKFDAYYVSKFMIQRLVEAEEIDYIADAIVGKSLDDRKLNIFKEGDFEILMSRLKDDLNRRTMLLMK